MLKRYIAICILGLLFTVTQQKVLAAKTNNKGFAITPYSFVLSLNPDEKKQETISLTNLTSEPADISVDARNFTANGEDGDVSLTTENTPFSLASWISIEPTHIIIPPQTKLPFTFTIMVPKNAEPGGHFGSVVFKTNPPKNMAQTGALLSQEIGSLIFVTTPGEIKQKAEIVSFTTAKSFYDEGPVTFIVRIKNESNTHIHPTGTITIADMFGKTYTISLESQNILPGATRKLYAHFNQKLLIGKYTVSTHIVYGDKRQPVTATTTFSAFPIKWGLVVLGIFLFIILINVSITLMIVNRHKK